MKLLTVQDAARILAISQWTVRAYVRKGKLQPIRLGRSVRIDERELEKFISALSGNDVASENLAWKGEQA